MKTQIFLQARIGSTRLPGKVLMKICGKSVFALTVERLSHVEGVDSLVLVTGPKEKNLALVREAKRMGFRYFCGSEENTLDRFYRAARHFKPDAIIRVTCDCPLIDADLISQGLRIFKKGNYDVVSTSRERTYPDGFDFEVFSRKALEIAWKDTKKSFKTEKAFTEASIPPTKYLLEKKKFKNKDMLNSKNLGHIRLTLDYPEDFTLIAKIYKKLYSKGEYFSAKEIFKFLKERPEILNINKKYLKLDYGIRKGL